MHLCFMPFYWSRGECRGVEQLPQRLGEGLTMIGAFCLQHNAPSHNHCRQVTGRLLPLQGEP